MPAVQTSSCPPLFSNHNDPPPSLNHSMWPGHMVGQREQPVRVFLVDDDSHIRRVIAQDLMGDSRTLLVGHACSLREARKSIQQHDFDVLMIDLNLGDGEGLDLLELVQGTHPHVQSIIVSVTERDEKVFQAFEKGAVGYLLKNSWFGDYAQAVLQVANGGASITPSLAKKILSLVSRSQTYVVPASNLSKEEKLSEREIEILKLIACGYSSPEISTQLKISTMTVSTHVKNMYRKLQAKTRAHAVKAASLRGLI